MELLVALSEPRLREMMDAAARHAGWPAARLARLPAPGEDGAAHEAGSVLVHDLLPEPDRQVEHLRALAAAEPSLRVFLLLPLDSRVLCTAVRHGAGLPLVAVDVSTPELTASLLAERLRLALSASAPGLVVWARVQRWPLGPTLRELARATLVGLHLHRGVGKLARELGISYERARREASECGVGAPGLFAETLRLACAAVALAQGARVYQAAASHGFHDADHLGSRLRRRFGITPSRARAVGGEALLDELEASWFQGIGNRE